MVRSRKIITHKHFRTKSSVLGPKTLHVSMSKSNSPGCHGQLNNSSLHQQTGRDSLSGNVMSWCHQFKISLSARHIPWCLNVIADSLSRSTEIQSTEWSLHPLCVRKNLQKVVHSSGGSVFHTSKPQVATLRFCSTR